MEDAQIVDLYWTRSEYAITETAVKYGNYCYAIAYRILANSEDADESVNDTFLNAWNAMPPHRPSILSTFLGKITRRLSIDKWRRGSAEKRGSGELPLALEELNDCVPARESVEQAIECKELASAINRFLAALPETERDLFICRYWFLASIREISKQFHMSESSVKTTLFRIRSKLLTYLQKEGY